MSASAYTTSNDLLFIGDEDGLPFDEAMAETRGFNLSVVPAHEVKERFSHKTVRRKGGQTVVLIGTETGNPLSVARQVQESDTDAMLAFLSREKDADRYRHAALLTSDLRGVPTLCVEDGPESILEQLETHTGEWLNARRLESVLGQINKEIHHWAADHHVRYRQLTSTDQYLNALLVSAPDGIIATDNEGAIVAWNEAATTLYGYAQPEAAGKHISLLFSEEEEERLAEALDRVRSGDVLRGERFSCERSDGRTWPAEITMAPVRTNKGDTFGISVICRNIAERIAREQEREELLRKERAMRAESEMTNARLRFLTEAGAILSSSLDYHTTLRRVAEVAVPEVADWCVVDMLSGEEGIDRLALSHRDPQKKKIVRDLLQRYPPNADPGTPVHHVLTTCEPFFIGDVTDEMIEEGTKDEYHRDVVRSLEPRSIMIAPLMVQDRPIGVVTLAMAESGRRYERDDVSFIMEIGRRASMSIENAMLYRDTQQLNADLERRVRQRTEALTAANKELEMFSYSVSHDLRTPLRAIEGFARILSEDYGDRLDSEGQRLLGVVRRNAIRMGELISDLLDFARMKRTHLSRSQVDMEELVEEAFRELVAEEKDRAGEIEIRKGELPVAWADRALLRQVVLNLLSNAIKFTRPKKHAVVAVDGRVEGTMAHFTIKDNGVGFDMEFAGKLFKVFQRLHSPRDFEGSGIGLAIVHRIVTAHGGEVWADSKEGEGTTITFSLPKRAP